MTKKYPISEIQNPASGIGNQDQSQQILSNDEPIECMENQDEPLINNPVFQEGGNEVPTNEIQNENDQEENTKVKGKNDEKLEKFSKNFVEYMKRKLEELREEASTHGKGKVGKKTKLVSALMIILPTIIAACLMALPAQTYKTLLAGGAVTIISGFTVRFISVFKWLINKTLGKWHRKRAKTIIEKLDVNNFLSDIIQAEDEQFLKSEARKIYSNYQNQFNKVNFDLWTIEKLAVDAVDRIMNYLAEGSSTKDDFITKGVVLGKSKMNWVRRGKTVKFDNNKCNTADFYSEVDPLGIRYTENEKWKEVLLTGCRRCNPAKCGWRYTFSWEMTIAAELTSIDIIA